MTQFGKGSKGATQLLDDIAKNGAPKLDSTSRNALQAYRETIRKSKDIHRIRKNEHSSLMTCIH